jgi:hypothetical protein
MTRLGIKSFKVAYVILILSAILAFTAGEIYSYYALIEQKGNYILIETTGRQRTNSFLINNLLLNSEASPSNYKSLDSLITRLSTVHQSLKSGSVALEIPEMEEKIFPCYDSLDVAFKAYIEAVKMIKTSANANNKAVLLARETTFIFCVDNLIDCFKRDNEDDYNRFRNISWVIHFAGVAILLLEFFLIFIPMIQRIQRHNDKLTSIAFNQSHIIRHPLTNIMAMLQLIDKNKLDEKQATYISLMDKEAKELDKVIRESITALSGEMDER